MSDKFKQSKKDKFGQKKSLEHTNMGSNFKDLVATNLLLRTYFYRSSECRPSVRTFCSYANNLHCHHLLVVLHECTVAIGKHTHVACRPVEKLVLPSINTQHACEELACDLTLCKKSRFSYGPKIVMFDSYFIKCHRYFFPKMCEHF